MTASSSTAAGLYLELETGEGAAARLAAAMAGAQAKAVLIHPAAAGRTDKGAVRSLVQQAQAGEAAALIADDVEMARASGADGVHLSWTADIEERYAQARRALGDRLIVGADAGTSHHDAMALGEAGADYIGFGGTGLPAAERLELVGWWAEIFVVPCVAFGVADAGEAAALAAAGADFLGVPLDPGGPPASAQQRTRAVQAVLRACSGEPDGQSARGRA